jgi:hypothetical protein
MSFLDRNLALLEACYPALAKRFAAPPVSENSGNSGGSWHVERAATGAPTLAFGSIHIHSPRDPEREAQRQSETVLSEGGNPPDIIILLGFGLGYTAETLAKKGKILIIVEKRPELFRLALEERNLEALFSPGTALFVIGGNSGAVTGALALLEKTRGPSSLGGRIPAIIKNRALISLTTEDETWYAEAERRIRTWTSKDTVNAATLKRFGRRWTRNLGANLPAVPMLPGVKHLENILKNTGIPVFLAAAGPSLNRIEPFLTEIHRRCLMVAVDTSLRFLVHRGLKPDFVLSVDPQYWNARHLHRLTVPETTLIAESAVYPPALRFNAVRRLFCRSLFPLGRFIEDRTDPKGALGAGGSVATTAWDFARLLGPAEIWIAGLDLGFPGYQTHFKGALFEENAHAQSSRLCPAETLSVQSLENGIPFSAEAADGNRILTDKRLSLYAAWFENRFSQEQSLTNYSLSSRGLAIPGLQIRNIETLLSLPLRREAINHILEERYTALDGEFFSPEAQKEREKRYTGALQSLIRGLEEIRDSSERAAAEAKRAFVQLPSKTEQEKLLQRLDRVNKTIMESPVKEAAGFLFPPSPELEKKLSTPESEPLKRHLEFSSLLYRSLAEAAEFTLGTLKNAILVK